MLGIVNIALIVTFKRMRGAGILLNGQVDATLQHPSQANGSNLREYEMEALV